MKYQLIIQIPESEENFNQIIAVEEILEENLLEEEVDGHDIGSGQINLFIFTNKPLDTFKHVKVILKGDYDFFSKIKIAYRITNEDIFHYLWPSHLTDFKII